MTYTPEPWLNELHASDRKVGKGDFAWICEVRTQIGALIAHVYANDKSICEDQARLIATAPDLLMMLEALVDDDECRLDHSGFCQTHTNEMDDGQCAMVVARAAIKKALS
ncbi:hypothetical protein LCGC14_0610460 [marine sediment metagenome]|uniref:Uncharacterized protein n=1 Tax=marine sediment metagenome TaxID=412755 RepID=A0A0F9RS23_9ZZZZ